MDKPDTLAAALDAFDKGYTPIPCAGKVPLVKYKEFRTDRPTREQIAELFAARPGANLAILTDGMVLFDVDRSDLAELVIEKCGETSHKLKTPRGFHLGYRRRMGLVLKNSVKIKGLDLDIRTTAGIEIIAPSFTEQGGYEWLTSGLRPISELPLAKIGWTRERKKKPPKVPAVTDAYAAAALRYEAERVAAAEEGTRNATLNRAAYSLGGLVAVGLLSRAAVEAALFHAAVAAGLSERETAATIQSGIEAGIKRPRTV